MVSANLIQLQTSCRELAYTDQIRTITAEQIKLYQEYNEDYYNEY